jgi:hypothetical protein
MVLNSARLFANNMDFGEVIKEGNPTLGGRARTNPGAGPVHR